MNIKELKKEARKNLKRNFLRTILVTFIAGIIINGGYNYSTYIYDNTNIMNKGYTYIKTNYEALKNVISNFTNDGYDARGVIAPLVNNITENRSITVGAINTVNNLVFKNNLNNTTIIILAFMLSLFFYVFIQNVFKVGRNRYFLEQRRYNTKIEKILFPYQISRAWHIAYVSFYKSLYQLLWIPTIIGGIIKHYEYKMIPYILATNPNVTREEAFNLSKELSNGYKMDMVKLDLSLIGWYILQIMTFGISSVFYFDAYKETIYTELYMYLRKTKYDELTNKDLLNDQYLDIDEYQNKTYPMDKFIIKSKKYNIDYMRKYKITTYILLFFTFSFAGWVWEVLLGIFESGIFVNRGALHGPWLPIYGTGCLVTLILLKPLRKHPVLFFIGAMILCGTIEYGTAWFLETFKNLRWWSYDGYFLNLQGRICLEGLLVFGLASTANTYFLAPFMDNIYSKIPHKLSIILCIILVSIYGVDFIYSQNHPNTGYGVSGELQVIDD